MGLENLQIDLITEILLRLPVKSLLRYRCVCKAFNSIISSQNFINSHVKITSDKRTHRQLVYRESQSATDKNSLKIHVLDIKDGSKKVFPIINMPPLHSFNTFLQAHCNGLLLLGQSFNSLTVWNPSTRKCRKLPVCPVKVPHNACGVTKFGLGYDSSADDYKVVVIKEIQGPKISRVVEVWIFGLNSNSWRKIQDFPYLEYRIEDVESGTCFTDGALHYLCRHGQSYIIIAFDLEKETFSVVPQPVYETSGCLTRLQVLEGRLCISFCSVLLNEVALFVRKRDGTEFSWSKLFSVSTEIIYCLKFGKLLGLSDGGDKILILYNKHIFSYEIGLCVQDIGIKDIQSAVDLDLILCIESLVSVGCTD
ncbi:F-box/kelch-repeat protein At3g23880-like [Euphorbia lathyris]|uniref:F-box/kelch-repeat protein At3g23880-like n=1 Tax=Euphorbia lathyris TaxID=212925 RepID=UPI003313A575